MKNSVFKYIGVYTIRLYQFLISPFFPNACRFDPSCSSFAITAINKYGILKGSRFTLRRLTLCHPWSKKSGYDPVQ